MRFFLYKVSCLSVIGSLLCVTGYSEDNSPKANPLAPPIDINRRADCIIVPESNKEMQADRLKLPEIKENAKKMLSGIEGIKYDEKSLLAGKSTAIVVGNFKGVIQPLAGGFYHLLGDDGASRGFFILATNGTVRFLGTSGAEFLVNLNSTGGVVTAGDSGAGAPVLWNNKALNAAIQDSPNGDRETALIAIIAVIVILAVDVNAAVFSIGS